MYGLANKTVIPLDFCLHNSTRNLSNPSYFQGKSSFQLAEVVTDTCKVSQYLSVVVVI